MGDTKIEFNKRLTATQYLKNNNNKKNKVKKKKPPMLCCTFAAFIMY